VLIGIDVIVDMRGCVGTHGFLDCLVKGGVLPGVKEIEPLPVGKGILVVVPVDSKGITVIVFILVILVFTVLSIIFIISIGGMVVLMLRGRELWDGISRNGRGAAGSGGRVSIVEDTSDNWIYSIKSAMWKVV